MLPIFLVLITTLASPHPEAEGASHDSLALPEYSILHGCAAASGGLASHWALPCGVEAGAPALRGPSFAGSAGAAGSSVAAERGNQVSETQAGFLHLDLLRKSHFGAGPELSWVAPDRPHEDLLRQRQVAPGVGIWYSPLPSLLFLGISANTQVSTLGETWFVNALSSEARCALSL